MEILAAFWSFTVGAIAALWHGAWALFFAYVLGRIATDIVHTWARMMDKNDPDMDADSAPHDVGVEMVWAFVATLILIHHARWFLV